MRLFFVVCVALVLPFLVSSRVVSFVDSVTGRLESWDTAIRPLTILSRFDEQPDDVYEVSHTETPLFKEGLGELLRIVNAYHVGIVFRNLRTGQGYTSELPFSTFLTLPADFMAYPSVIETMFPVITPPAKNERLPTLTWVGRGVTRFMPQINTTYWDKIEPLYNITGDIFKTFVEEYIEIHNSTEPWYKLFEVRQVDSHTSWKKAPVVLPGRNCFQFMENGFELLRQLGAVPLASAPVSFKVDRIAIIVGSPPEELDFEEHKVEVIHFYRALEEVFYNLTKIEKTFEKILQMTIEILQKGYIYHWEGRYFRLRVASPYAIYEYRAWKRP